MRLITSLLLLGCTVSLSPGQWIETTIPLPDSLSGLSSICGMVFHSPNHTVYVAGNDRLVAVDAGTHAKLAAVALAGSPDIMCSSPVSNKVYCALYYQRSVWVLDCSTNSFRATIPVDSAPREMCYARAENKVYVACPQSDSVKVIDCDTDSVVATIGPLLGVVGLCYHPALNRVYSVQSRSDEVAAIDCAADSVVRTIWVRGVEPVDICYDSVTNRVYTANLTSNTVSVIDCAGDSVVRIVAVGEKPWSLLAGPQGKMFCSGDDSALTVIDGGETRTVPVGNLWRWSYDPANRKIYHASWTAHDVAVVDAVGESVLVRVDLGEGTNSLCYDPVGNSTWAANQSEAAVGMIDGETNLLTDSLWFGIFYPRALQYNPLNNRLYCLDRSGYSAGRYLAVIDGDSGHVLKIMPASAHSMIWNPVSNKVYLLNSDDATVSIVDCTSDSIAATIGTQGGRAEAMCCSDDGRVYVVNRGDGVTVIDPSGDTVRTVVPVGNEPRDLCYDRTDNKVYVGKRYADPVSVIDANTDSVVATVPVPADLNNQAVLWSKNYNKVYLYGRGGSRVIVIDCANDTVLKRLTLPFGLFYAYSDSLSDKVYFADAVGNLRIVDAKYDSFYKSVVVGSVGEMTDNGRPGSDHRLYSAGSASGNVAVVSGETDMVLRWVRVGDEPVALAWNPAHSWVYVANHESSSITVVRDTLMLGVAENRPQASSRRLQTTIVGGVLVLVAAGSRQNAGSRAELLDATGRKVADLKPGANDVRALAPGVYFVRRLETGDGRPVAVIEKVVVTR